MHISRLAQAGQLAKAREETLDLIDRLDEGDDTGEWLLVYRESGGFSNDKTFHIDESVIREALAHRVADLERGLQELGVSI